MVHNMQYVAGLPTDEYTDQTENHEKSLRNKVQYRDWKLNTLDKKIDELTMEVMTHKDKEHNSLDMKEKIMLLASKSKESTHVGCSQGKIPDVFGEKVFPGKEGERPGKGEG